MNKFIYRELEKIRADMTPYDENTTTIIVSKRDGPNTDQFSLKLGGRYRFHIENYIINEPSNFTLSSNWNKGIKPVSKCLEGTILDFQGQMIKFNANGFDETTNTPKTDTYPELWLPKKAVTILGEYKFI